MPDLQELVDGLAARLGRPVAIEDRRYRVLAYSAHAEPLDRVRMASILTREAPADLAAWLDAQGLGAATAPMRLAPPEALGMGPRVAVPVHAANGGRDATGVLGFVWLIDDGVGPAELEDAQRVAAAAAPLLAPRRDLVADLLGEDGPARDRAIAALRGRGPYRVVVGHDLVPGPRLLVSGDIGVRFGSDAGPVGSSGPRDQLEDARAALAEAQVAARLGGRWEELGAYRLLAPLAGTPLPSGLRRLLDHPDADPLVATLETYLDRAGDAQATAAALFIHRTTLYHRLRRIAEITGADLRDGDDRLTLHVGLRIRRLAQ